MQISFANRSRPCSNLKQYGKTRENLLAKRRGLSLALHYLCPVHFNHPYMLPLFQRPIVWHAVALLTVACWGTTFISTKFLISAGFTPEEIFVLRFLMAYLGILFMAPRKLWCRSWQDEGLLILAGMTGGSLYFWSENTALEMTLATNVSFIVCTAPLLTLLLSLLFEKRRTRQGTRRLLSGALIALTGVALVIFNGKFILQLSPLGDLLSLVAASTWAVYSLLIRRLMRTYGGLFVTRKVFFYGLLTILPVFCFRPWNFPLSGFSDPLVWGNLLFLGILASLICFAVWNVVIEKLGMVEASNYIYLNPVFTLLAASAFLDEQITPLALLGITLIMCGVYRASSRGSKASRKG